MGFDLFDRRGRCVVLNPAGEALLRGVQAALAQLDDGVQAAAAAANSGTLLSQADGTNMWGVLAAQPGPPYAGFVPNNKAILNDGSLFEKTTALGAALVYRHPFGILLAQETQLTVAGQIIRRLKEPSGRSQRQYHNTAGYAPPGHSKLYPIDLIHHVESIFFYIGF